MTGTLILIAGHAGVGKTTITTALCDTHHGWVPIDKDTATGPVAAAAMLAISGDPDDRDSAEYCDRIKPAEYEALTATAVHAATYGATVIATAPWAAQLTNPRWVAGLESTCAATGIGLAGIWVECTRDEHLDRIVRRGAQRDHGKRVDLPGWHATLTTPRLPAWMRVFDNTAHRPDTETVTALRHLLPDTVARAGVALVAKPRPRRVAATRA